MELSCVAAMKESFGASDIVRFYLMYIVLPPGTVFVLGLTPF